MRPKTTQSRAETSDAESAESAHEKRPTTSRKRPASAEKKTEPEKPAGSKTAHGAALRSIWKGAISFGMVTIPVRMMPATTSKDLAFNLLHEKCNTRLKQIRWCPTCDRAVEWNETVRGYEYAKGQYVRLTDEDFEQIPRPARHTIDLSAFVRLDEIDPIYYEKSYYLDPEPAAGKSFALLVTALERKQLTAIARIAIRERERLCALRAAEGALVLETLYYADELRQHHSAGSVDVSERELDMALKLIDFLTEEFHPEKYRDEYRDAVLQLIEAKMQGAQVVRPPERHDDKIIDLMDALRASLAAAQSQKEQPQSKEQGRTRTRRPTKTA